MNEVEFEEDKWKDNSYTSKNKKESKMVIFLIKMKLVNNEEQANILLISISCIFLLISGFLLYNSFFYKAPTEPIYLEDLSLKERSSLPPDLLKEIPSRNAVKK